MQDSIATLRSLIACCRDSATGFEDAARNAHGDVLRERLIGVARQRETFAEELAGLVREVGGELPVSGAPGKAWRPFAKSSRFKDDRPLLDECIRADENTLLTYEQALTHELPAALRPVVERQRLTVLGTLMELRSIELARRAG